MDELNQLNTVKQLGWYSFFETLEAQLIRSALIEANNNCAKAAKLLGLKRTLLVHKRKKYGFPIKEAAKRGL
jgi:transcriptional regulator with GAF, ATPase, and Fis domain